MPVNELMEIEAFDEETVEELRNRARNALLTEAIKREENLEQAEKDLLDLEDMDADLAAKLAENSIRTRDDLGELAVDELTEMTGIDDERAKRPDHGGARALVRVGGAVIGGRRTAGLSRRRNVMASITVAQFATELKVPPQLLLEQLRAAGVVKRRRKTPFPTTTSHACWIRCARPTAARRPRRRRSR